MKDTEVTQIKNTIQSTICDVLKEMVNLRTEKYKDSWRDENNKTGAVISSEALLCFFSPQFSNVLSSSVIENVIEDEIIFNSINEILELTKDGFYGEPYINLKPQFGKDQEFIDAACHVSMALSLFKL